MKILLTADWQMRFANLDYCARAHEQELKIIKKYGVDVHVDLGDQKDEYNPIDGRVTEFCMRRADAIAHATAGECIRLLGNHDRFGQHTDSHNWFSIFKNIDGVTVDSPTSLDFGSVLFNCIPFRKTPEDTIAAAKMLANKTKNAHNILLFHNDIASSRYNTHGSTSTSKITSSSMHFKKYDQCFGGHIHLRQRLAKNAWFVGNPFATDLGEINQEKGFLLYDTETSKTKFIASVVPGVFTWGYIKKNRPTSLPAGTKIRADVRCDKSDINYHSKLEKVAEQIEQAYPSALPFVLPKFEAVSDEKEVVVDPNSSDYEKILSYIRTAVPESLANKKKKLATYMSALLQKTTGHALSRSSGKLTFESFAAKNVLSFAKLEYDLRNRGLVIVQGKNKDWPNHSNGSGKSNFLSIIPIVLCDQTFKGQKKDAWASDLNDRPAIASLTMTNDRGQRIVVERGRRKPLLKMSIDGKDQSTGLRSTGKLETQGQVEEFTGMNFQTLANSVYIDQRMSNAFLTGTPKERADLIHSFLNLERFLLTKQEVGKQISKVKLNLETFESSIAVTKGMLEDIEEDERNAKKAADVSIKQLKTKYDSAVKHQKAIERKYSKRLAVLRKRLDGLDKEITDKDSRIQKVGTLLVISAEKVANVAADLDALKNQRESECPTCLRPFDKKALKNAILRLQKKAADLRKWSEPVEDRRVLLKKQLFEARKAHRYVDNKISEIESHIEKVSRLAENAKLEYETYKKAASPVDASDKRTALRRDLVRAERTVVYYNEELAFLDFAAYAFSRDGLPSFLANLLIPRLNKAAEYYSSTFIDSEIQILFEIDKGQIYPKIINAHGGKSLQAQSMGESAWAGIVTAFALREIALPSNLLILDEPGNGLDPESAKIFGQRLPRLKDRFETILVVTHNQHIASSLEADQTLTVVKHHKRSELR